MEQDTKRCQKCKELNRRVQQKEKEIAALKRQLKTMRVDPWAGSSRKAEAEERDRVANVIQKTEDRRWKSSKT